MGFQEVTGPTYFLKDERFYNVEKPVEPIKEEAKKVTKEERGILSRTIKWFFGTISKVMILFRLK